jgi:hypothetical protein
VPRQLTEQSTLFFGHRDLHLDTPNQIHIARTTKKSQTLSEAEGLKAHVRKAAPRTIDALETAAADALLTFKPIECENFFTHAGYGFD